MQKGGEIGDKALFLTEAFSRNKQRLHGHFRMVTPTEKLRERNSRHTKNNVVEAYPPKNKSRKKQWTVLVKNATLFLKLKSVAGGWTLYNPKRRTINIIPLLLQTTF